MIFACQNSRPRHSRMMTRHIGHDSCMLISSLAAIPRQNRKACPVTLVSIRVPSAAIPRQNQTSKNFTKLLRTLRSYGQTVIPPRPYLGKITIVGIEGKSRGPPQRWSHTCRTQVDWSYPNPPWSTPRGKLRESWASLRDGCSSLLLVIIIISDYKCCQELLLLLFSKGKRILEITSFVNKMNSFLMTPK